MGAVQNPRHRAFHASTAATDIFSSRMQPAMTNPLLELDSLPRFDAILPAHVTPAIDELIGHADAAMAHAETVVLPTWDNLVAPLTYANERLWRAWRHVNHLQAVVNTPEIRQAFNENLPKMTAFGTRFGQHAMLYAQYQRLAESPAFPDLHPARRQVVNHALRDFRLGGVALPEEKKLRFAQVRQELSRLSAKFAENVLDATDNYTYHVEDAAALDGLPPEVVATAREKARQQGRTGWAFGLQMPVYLPVQMHAKDRSLRRALYLASIARASELDAPGRDNGPLVDQTLALRAELAGLLGFDNFASLSLATKMAETPAQVLDFVRNLASHARPMAQRERAELEAFARGELGLNTVEPWDVTWASVKLKQDRYGFSPQEVKQYFTEPKVLAGLFGTIESLYGVHFESDTAPVWHEDVRLYRVVDADGRVLGHCYMDLYAREGKRSGAWMDISRNRQRRGEALQTPVAHLVCNFGRGADGQPATLGHDEVITLFHEMGHCLHQLLTEVDEADVAGVAGVEWDAVELPSQFMENFCWEWRNLEGMSAHVETGAPIPFALFDRMLAAKNFHIGMTTSRHIEFSLLDMLLHSEFDSAADSVLASHQRIRDEVAAAPAHESDRFTRSFSHIFAGGYAAGYYSYKWAEVLSADVYDAFTEDPNQLATIGARFRSEVLARGGSRPAIENFRAFLGRDPDMTALLRQGGMVA